MPTYSIAGHWLSAISFAARADFSCVSETGLSRTEILHRLRQNLPQTIFQKIRSQEDGQVSCRFITITDPHYPQALKEIPYAPPVLFYQGDIKRLTDPKIAIVGTRFCSTMAKNFTFNFSRILSKACSVVSGLAYGIDKEAHMGALSKTIGVAGQGLQAPRTNYQQHLYQKIISAGGLLLSEFHPEATAKKWTFVQRNRTIAGLSKALVVVEAPSKSGALISAQNALDFNREVYAVPNHPFHQNARGCLRLIQDGAHIAISPQQIVEEMGMTWQDPILKALYKPMSIQTLSKQLEQSASTILAQLSGLESDGLVQNNGLFWEHKRA